MEPVERLDLRGTACPMNFVRIKIALDSLPEGAFLEVRVDPEPVSREVERSLAEQGYRVLSRVEKGAFARLTVAR